MKLLLLLSMLHLIAAKSVSRTSDQGTQKHSISTKIHRKKPGLGKNAKVIDGERALIGEFPSTVSMRILVDVGPEVILTL